MHDVTEEWQATAATQLRAQSARLLQVLSNPDQLVVQRVFRGGPLAEQIGRIEHSEQLTLGVLEGAQLSVRPLFGDLSLEPQYRTSEWSLLGRLDRKSTRLNSSHVKISYAVFCLKKK